MNSRKFGCRLLEAVNPLNNFCTNLARLGDAPADSHCYGLLGDFDGRCDRNFVELLPSAITEAPSRESKNAGLLALLCTSRWANRTSGWARPFSRGLTQVTEGSGSPR